MSGGKNQRALLMEIMVAVLFFALCASVLLQTFAAAREYSRRAGVEGEALLQAQSLASLLYVREDADAALRESGFEERGGVWTRQEDEYSLSVSGQEEATPSGTLRTMTVRVLLGETVMAELPVARYAPGEAEQ